MSCETSCGEWKSVVCGGEPLCAGDHDVAAVRVVAFSDGSERAKEIAERKGFEAVGRRIAEPF